MKKKIILILFILSILFFSCDEENTLNNDDYGPKPKSQTDFIGEWESGAITVNITNSNFELINQARIPNIIFRMNVSKWENVPCQMTLTKIINGIEVPDEEFSKEWRKGRTTYKITGTVTSNNSPYNDLAKVGNTQNIYLNHSGYAAMYIGTTPTDASGSALFKNE